jgi:hypothetical protein
MISASEEVARFGNKFDQQYSGNFRVARLLRFQAVKLSPALLHMGRSQEF